VNHVWRNSFSTTLNLCFSSLLIFKSIKRRNTVFTSSFSHNQYAVNLVAMRQPPEPIPLATFSTRPSISAIPNLSTADMAVGIENQLLTPPSSNQSRFGSPTTANASSTVSPMQSPELPPRPDLRARFFDTRYKKCVFTVAVLLMYAMACLCAVQALMPVVPLVVMACVLMIPVHLSYQFLSENLASDADTSNLQVMFLGFALVIYVLFRTNTRPAIASVISVVLVVVYAVACGIVYTYAPERNPYLIFNLWFLFLPVSDILTNLHMGG
jgi:hypothetical protein